MTENYVVRKAVIADALAIFELVNSYAAQGQMLPKSKNQVYQNIRDFVVLVDEDEQLLGCGALHVLWEDLAEVRSLAVREERQGNGLGRLILSALLDDARQLGLPIVFALTYQEEFFVSMGFRVIDKDELPRKIWVDCIDCIKFPHCDETAVIMALD